MIEEQATKLTKKQEQARARWAKAWAKGVKPAPSKIRHLYDDTYWVESRSYPGSGHHTTPESCTCTAGLHQRMCWHRHAVRAYHDWRMEQMRAAHAEPQAPRAPAPRTALAQTGELPPLCRHFE